MGRTWVVALLVSMGCGPIVYVNEVTRSASSSMAAARAAHAEKYSPYWWTRAVEYFHKAKEVAAHADFQAANHYGRLADEAAKQATVEAEIAAKDPSKRPLEPGEKLAPAKDTP